jgi:hypothetical protein
VVPEKSIVSIPQLVASAALTKKTGVVHACVCPLPLYIPSFSGMELLHSLLRSYRARLLVGVRVAVRLVCSSAANEKQQPAGQKKGDMPGSLYATRVAANSSGCGRVRWLYCGWRARSQA